MADKDPTHIVDQPGDKRSRCGIKNPTPVVWAPFVQAHVDGWGMQVCEECAGLDRPVVDTKEVP